MTLDEAIRHCEEVAKEKCYEYQDCLEANDSEAAKECVKCGLQHKQLAEWLKELKKLRSEQTDCEYCHEDSDGYIRPIEKNGHVSIHATFLRIKANGWSKDVKINFCPMCGRKLENVRN